MGVASSHRPPGTGWEDRASSCTKGGSGWAAGKIYSLEELSSFGRGYPGKWLSSHPWRACRWHLGMWFSDVLGSAGLTVGLNDHRGVLQPKWFHDFVNLCWLFNSLCLGPYLTCKILTWGIVLLWYCKSITPVPTSKCFFSLMRVFKFVFRGYSLIGTFHKAFL